jgi:hypothetical protein
MYKTRFTKWGFGKNNKRHEVLPMIRKRARRAAVGRASRFHVRGQPVDMTDVERYLRRAGLSVQDAIDLPAATPPTLRCSTPDSIIYSPKPPRQYEISESILDSIRNYISGSFDQGTWISTSDLQNPRGFLRASEFFHTMGIARDHLNGRQIRKAGIYLNFGFARIKSMLIEQTSEMLLDFFYFVICFQYRYPDITTAMTTQFADMSLIVLEGSHPLKQLFIALRSPDLPSVQKTAEMAASCMVDIFELKLGRSHIGSYDIRSRFVMNIKGMNNLQGSVTECRENVARLEYAFGKTDPRCIIARADWAYSLRHAGRLIEAEGVALELVRTIEAFGCLVRRTRLSYSGALCILSSCQRGRGDFQAAIKTLHEKMNFDSREFWGHDTLMANNLKNLRYLLGEMGRQDKADEVDQRISEIESRIDVSANTMG